MNTKALADMRWVGVSGLAVGALAALPDAEAAITVTDVNQTVGFTAGSPSYTLTLRGSSVIAFSANSGGALKQIYLNGLGGVGASNASFRAILSTAVVGDKDKTWNQVGTRSTNMAAVANKSSTLFQPADYSHKYLMFKFDDTSGGAALKYGWAELSQNNIATTGPDITIHRWAYDTTGAQIIAGAVPEPASAAAATGMALVLGAAGVRAWRKQRQTKA